MSKMGLFFGAWLICLFALTSDSLAQQPTAGLVPVGCRAALVKCIKAPCPTRIICDEPTQTIKCGWCGTGCADMSKGDLRCPLMGPPAGKSCVNSSGSCVIISSGLSTPIVRPTLTSVCTPRPACLDADPPCLIKMVEGTVFCPKPTKVAQEGGMCGGFAGIMCATGLRCDYGTRVGPLGTDATNVMPDRSGVCVKDGLRCEWCGTGCRAESALAGVCPMIAPPGDKVCVPESGACVIKPRNPTCIPRPLCMDGIKDASGNVVYCDAKPGMVYCPNNRAGDANGDGKVDLVDFAYWKREYLSKLIAKADFNKDGKVDLVDFSIWKNSYLNLFTTN